MARRIDLSRTEYVKRGAVFTLLYQIVGTLFPFFVRTLLINTMGDEYNGLNGFCLSVLTMLSATELGVDIAMCYRLYKPIAEKDIEYIDKLLGFYRVVYFVIGIVVFLAGVLLLPMMEVMTNGSLPQNVNAQAVFFMYLLGAVFSYIFFTYKTILLQSLQRMDIVFAVRMVTSSCMYIMQIIALTHRNYYAYVATMPAESIMQGAIISVICKIQYKDIKPKGIISRNERNSFLNEVFSIAVYKIREVTRTSIDTVSISLFMGLVSVGLYQNYYMVYIVPVMLRGICMNVITPSVGDYAVTHNKKELFFLFKVILMIQLFLSGLFGICYYFLIEDFIVIWIGSQHLLHNNVAFLFLIYYLITGISEVFKVVRSSVGIWNRGRFAVLVEIAINIGLNILLGKRWGIGGIILATILAMMCVNIPVDINVVLKDYFEIHLGECVVILSRCIIWFILNYLLIKGIFEIIPEIYFWRLVIKGIVCLILPSLSFVIFFKKQEEFQMIKEKLCIRKKK